MFGEMDGATDGARLGEIVGCLVHGEAEGVDDGATVMMVPRMHTHTMLAVVVHSRLDAVTQNRFVAAPCPDLP